MIFFLLSNFNLRMEEIAWEFQQLKISVLKKLEKINGVTNKSCVPFESQDDIFKPRTTIKNEKGDSNTVSNYNKSPVQDYFKILEVESRKAVANNLESRLKTFDDFTRQQELVKKKQWLKKQQEFVDDIQQKENHIFQVLEEYDKTSSNTQAQLALYYKNIEIRKQQQENEIKKREREKQIIYECLDKIKKLQLSFRSGFEQIVANLKRCKKIDKLKALLKEEFQSINDLRYSFEGIVSKCKTGRVTEDDVEKAAEIYSNLQSLEKQICQGVDDINAEIEREKIPPKAEPSIAVEISTRTTTEATKKDTSNLEKYVSVTNLKMYMKLMDFYEKFLESFKNLESDSSQKQFILDCKKAINIPVNSLSGLNSEHILDKYQKLYKLLKGQDVIITEKRINASNHPEGIAFCINLLAKRFMLQSDLIISSNPESAFCYATVMMSLWNEFPIFGELVLAYFYKTCPYLVPYHIPKQEGESDEEFYKRQGYQYNNGEIEKQDKFLKRMTGIMRLYAAILIVKPKKGHHNLHNIQNGWRWLSSTLKLEPLVDITATMVHTFLEIAGFEMEACYGKAFQKMLCIIAEKFLPSCRAKCTGGAVTRLELLINEYRQKRKFEPPDGYLHYNYW